MGTRLLSSIFCDRCVASYHVARNDIREVRDIARQEGWRYDRMAGKDLCPDCVRRR